MSENPLLSITDLVDYAAIRPEHVEPAVKELLGNASATLETVTAEDVPATWEAVLEPLEESQEKLGRAWGAVTHLQSVVDTPALRDAVNGMLPAVASFSIDMSQNIPLMKKIRAIREGGAYEGLSPVRRRLIDRELRDFHLAGADLPEEKRARVKEIGEKLAQLSQSFSEHLLDATNGWSLTVRDRYRLRGLPENDLAFLASAAEAAGEKGWRITLHYPSYLPVMKYAEDRELRREVHHAFATRASDLTDPKWDNTPLMDEILALRAEEAALLGFRNYGEESLATKMADTPEEVCAFLRELAAKARPFALRDKADLEAFAAAELGIEKLEPWDIAWASEKLRRARYDYSDSEVREYFTEPTVFKGLFNLAGALYGIEIHPAEASVWHPDVKYFEVLRNGEVIASFYADLYAREGKRQGAWMNDDRTRKLVDGRIVTPTAFLVCNFAHGVDGEAATLTHDDVTTLFHEFGHCLHHLLTEQVEPGVAGINGVEWDAVELPSQFMENFAWEWEVVEKISAHKKTGEPLPRALFDKMLAAKNFQSGLFCLRQIEFGLFDMLIHTTPSPDVMGILKNVRDEVAVWEPAPYNRFPQSFSHIFAGGYAAGYYSYKWAEVLSSDAFAAFEETGVTNPETGRRFLKEILGRGSSRDAMDNFVAFRGRRPTLDALLRHSGMTEQK